jgi:hypothetical protein
MAQKQKHIDNIFFTCCILHNMILMDDGLDKRWDNQSEEFWHTLNPQVDNSDEGYDDEDSTTVQYCKQEAVLLARVAAIRYTDEQLAILGNEIVADIDNDYKTHKRKVDNAFLSRLG